MSTITVFDKIQNNILLQLKQAENRIRICVAWFTDEEILKTVLEQAKKGIYIEIVVLNDEYNRAKSNYFNQLVALNSKVYLVDKNNVNGMLHHKFCLIDYSVLITGSYNWTNNAKKNNENIVIVDFDSESPEDEYNMIHKYDREFDKILVQYGIEEEIDEDTGWDLALEYSNNQDKLFTDAKEYWMVSMDFFKEDKIDDALTAINTAISMYPFYVFYSVRQVIYHKQNKLIECCNDLFTYMEGVRSDDDKEINSFSKVYKKFINDVNSSFDNYKYLSEINNITKKNLGKFAFLNIEPHFFEYDDLEYPF